MKKICVLLFLFLVLFLCAVANANDFIGFGLSKDIIAKQVIAKDSVVLLNNTPHYLNYAEYYGEYMCKSSYRFRADKLVTVSLEWPYKSAQVTDKDTTKVYDEFLSKTTTDYGKPLYKDDSCAVWECSTTSILLSRDNYKVSILFTASVQ